MTNPFVVFIKLTGAPKADFPVSPSLRRTWMFAPRRRAWMPVRRVEKGRGFQGDAAAWASPWSGRERLSEVVAIRGRGEAPRLYSALGAFFSSNGLLRDFVNKLKSPGIRGFLQLPKDKRNNFQNPSFSTPSDGQGPAERRATWPDCKSERPSREGRSSEEVIVLLFWLLVY